MKPKTALRLLLASILCISLAACQPSAPQSSESQSDPTAASSGDSASVPDGSGANSSVDTSQPSAGSGSASTELPYSIQIPNPNVSIYEGPGYDYAVSGIVGTAGTYTIVEEEVDYEGILWGKLKSGAGWVDIASATSQQDSSAPIRARFADESTLSGGRYHEFIAEDSEYMVKLLFTSDEILTDVQLSLLAPGSSSDYEVTKKLYTLEELTPDMPLVAGVVFYGDMTAYGISFTDAQGQSRHFAAYISGRNGSLLLDEYTP